MSFRFIKNKIRNALIIAFYFTGIPYLRFLSFRRRNIPLFRIICWHKVKDRGRFEKKIRFLLKKFNIIPVEDYFEQKSLRTEKDYSPRQPRILLFQSPIQGLVDRDIRRIQEKRQR